MALAIGERLHESDPSGDVLRAIRESHAFLGRAKDEINEPTLSLSHKRTWLDMLLSREVSAGVALEDFELGCAYNDIGTTYGNLNMFEKAAESFHKCIEIYQKLDEFTERLLADPKTNLALIYWIQGKPQEAERVLIEVLKVHESAVGVDSNITIQLVVACMTYCIS